MADKHYKTTATSNWHEPANWEPAGVPTVDDCAWLDAGSAACVLTDDNAVCGEFISYSPAFNPNGKIFTVGNGGNGRYYQIATFSAVRSGTIRLHCDDVYIGGGGGATSLAYEFYSPCTVKQSATGSFRKLTIKNGGSVRYVPGVHAFDSQMTTLARLNSNGIGITIEEGGRLDMTDANVTSAFSSGAPSFVNLGGVVNNGAELRTISLESQASVAAGVMAGNIHCVVTMRANNSVLSGDLRAVRSVEIHQVTGYSGIVIAGELVLPDAEFLTCPANSHVTGDVTCFGDLTASAEWDLSGIRIHLAGTGDQTIAIGDNAVGLSADKPAGLATLASGDFTLAEAVTFGGGLDFAPYYSGCFSQNGKAMHITTGKLHLLELEQTQYVLSGDLVFSGNDFVLKNTVLPDDCVLVFTGHCTARFISENGKQCSPGGIHVEQNAQLVLATTKHGNVTGNVLNEIEISDNMTIMGTLGFYDPGQYRIVMAGEEKVCRPGKFITGSQSEIIIEPKSNSVQPMNVEITGNAHLFWGPDVTTILLLPGNYRGFREFCIPPHIAEYRLSSGEYDFDILSITTPQTGGILLTQNDTGNVVLRGQTVITGNGLCRNTIDVLRLEHLQLNALLEFAADCMQIDHPVVLGGNISGNGKLILSGTQPFHLNDDSLDVGGLHIFDGDGSFPVPALGYRSLTLETRNCDSLLSLRGEYHIANLTMIADMHTLTVDVDQTTTIRCTGDITTQKSGSGSIRWCGDGLETWIFEGDASQMLDMSFEHGCHVLGTMLNDKSGGTLTIVSPLSVVYYRKPDGTPLPTPVNMTILSALSLQCQLHLVTGGTGEYLSQEGTRLENGTILSGGTVAFYARLADQDGQPIHPNLVESIRMNCMLMNPLAPYLHDPRRTVVRDWKLEISRVLSPDWQTDEKRLPEGQTYNFCMDSAMFGELRFEQPGLYYVTFAVKMFGHKNAVPFRYEIHCERPLV